MFLFRSSRAALAALALAALAPVAARSVETLAGPYRTEVERAIDGDTLAVRVAVWLGVEASVRVRIRGSRRHLRNQRLLL